MASRPDVAAANRARWADPEYRARMSANQSARWSNPVYRERITAAVRLNWAKPDYRARMEGVLQNRVAPKIIPKKGTREHRHYCKVRDVLGTLVARETLGIESRLWLRRGAR